MARKVDLLQGTLDLIILSLLRTGPANGWGLTQSIQAVTRGALDVNYGSVYPALRRLEGQRCVRSRWDVSQHNRRARYYELTRAGRRRLVSARAEWKKFAAALRLILEAD